MTFENYIKGQLVSFAVAEAFAHGGINNMLAVAQVIRNRVSAGWGGGDWMYVLRGVDKVRGTAYPDPPLVNRNDINFRTLLQRIDDVYHNQTDGTMVEGALYYAELHNITEPWFETNILANLESHPIVGKVGQVTFFS